MKENWKDIPGFEGRYQVSDLGRVRSMDQRVRTVSKTGTETTRLISGRILKPQKHTHGYVQYSLAGRTNLAHALVAAAFIGARPEGYDVAHFDGNRKNNTPRNLRYATSTENHADKIRHGTTSRGIKNGAAKLTQQNVDEIRGLRGKEFQSVTATRYGVAQSTISKIQLGTRWQYA